MDEQSDSESDRKKNENPPKKRKTKANKSRKRDKKGSNSQALKSCSTSSEGNLSPTLDRVPFSGEELAMLVERLKDFFSTAILESGELESRSCIISDSQLRRILSRYGIAQRESNTVKLGGNVGSSSGSDSGYGFSISTSSGSNNNLRQNLSPSNDSSSASNLSSGPDSSNHSSGPVDPEIPLRHQYIGIVGMKGTGRNHLAACLAGLHDGGSRIYERESRDRNYSVVVVPTDPSDPMPAQENPLYYYWERRTSMRVFDAVVYIYAIDNPPSLARVDYWHDWIIDVHPDLRRFYLVCNKMDLTMDTLFMRQDFIERFTQLQAACSFRALFLECSALYRIDTVHVEQCILGVLLPELYGPPHHRCLSASVFVPGKRVFIVGEENTGRNTLAYRLTNLVAPFARKHRRLRRVPCPNRQTDVNLEVHVVPTSFPNQDIGESRYWTWFGNHIIHLVILLYAVNRGPSLRSLVQKWRRISLMLPGTSSRPLVFLVGNKKDLRPFILPHNWNQNRNMDDPRYIVTTEDGMNFAQQLRIPENNFFECSARYARGTAELQQDILNKLVEVDEWC